MAVFTLQRLVVWIAIVFCGFLLSFILLHNIAIAIALAGLVAAVSGTILYGEERMPFVVGGLVLLLLAGVTDFEHIVENMEWVLFIKLVGLLTWVDFLNRSGYFDKLIERFMPRNLTGFKLLALLFILASLSAALIDEVNSIVLWYAVGRALIGFDRLGNLCYSASQCYQHWLTISPTRQSCGNCCICIIWTDSTRLHALHLGAWFPHARIFFMENLQNP